MKNRNLHLFLVATATLLAASCSSFDPWDDIPGDRMQNPPDSPIGGMVSDAYLSGDLATFMVSIDSTALAETDIVKTDNEDYLENNTFSHMVYIRYDGATATVEGLTDGIHVDIDGACVVVRSTVKGVNYVLSGTTSDGMFKMASTGEDDKKMQLTLNGVNIHHSDGPAINIQPDKRCYVHVADGTFNSLTDGSSYADSDEDQKATLFSEGKLLFSGKGRLRVYANAKNGICSDDYILFRPGNDIYVKSTSSNCIKSNDGIYVCGGVINCETSATASKGMKTDGEIQIDGGRVTCITTGNGEYDSDDKDCKGAAGIKCDQTFVMNNGELRCMSTGSGGKGISTDGMLTVNGGTVRVVTTGARYTYGTSSTSSKGIKSDAEMRICGGDIMVRCLGGESAEALESKAQLYIADGKIACYAYDDAINAKTHVGISGGKVFCYSIHNDGIDSNGTLTVSGGLAIACGTTTPEDGFDCDQHTFTVTGGTLIGLGGGSSIPASETDSQPVAVVGGSSLSAGQYLALSSSVGDCLLAFCLPRSYAVATVLVSSPRLKIGSLYTLTLGATIGSAEDNFYGFLDQPSASGGSAWASFPLSSVVTTYNYNSNMGDGMAGGGMSPGGGGKPW